MTSVALPSFGLAHRIAELVTHALTITRGASARLVARMGAEHMDYPPRRSTYADDAAMHREMYRL